MNERREPSTISDRHTGRLVLRADLAVQPSDSAEGTRWVVSDAFRGRHFILSEIEYWILSQCAVGNDPATILKELRRRHPDRRVTVDTVVEFLARAVQDGLLIRKGTTPSQPKDDPGMVAPLNPLAIRLPGIDPSRFLSRILPAIGWIFAPTTLAMWSILGVWGFVTMVGHWDRLVADLAALRDGWTPISSVAIISTIALTKIIHEMSHALVCHHLGGRCREMGVLLLMFAPALYCDVSDAWAFGRLSSRIWVSLAGVLAELVLAAMAAILWSIAQPGPLRSTALLVMTTCSVATLAINLNPLMNHDGYYILSDLLGIPNLASESRQWWGQRLRIWLLDLPALATEGGSTGWIPPVYAVVSGAYRLGITFLMVVALNHVLEKQHLAPLGTALTFSVLCGIASTPMIFAWRLVGDARSRRLLVRRRVAIGLTIATILLAAVFWLPLPRHVVVPAVLEPDAVETVYIPVGGRLEGALPARSVVARNQPILWLSDPDLESRLLRLETEHSVLQRRLSALAVRRVDEVSLGGSIPSLEESLSGVRSQIELIQTEFERLTVRAPRAGILLDPPPRDSTHASSLERQLSRYTCSPLDGQALGTFLERGETVCQVSPGGLRATLSVPESEVELLSPGQIVQLRLPSRLDQAVQGHIVEIGQTPASESIAEAKAQREWSLQGGSAVPPEKRYQVTVQISGTQPPWPPGASAWGRVKVAPASLGTRLWHWVCRSFRIE